MSVEVEIIDRAMLETVKINVSAYTVWSPKCVNQTSVGNQSNVAPTHKTRNYYHLNMINTLYYQNYPLEEGGVHSTFYLFTVKTKEILSQQNETSCCIRLENIRQEPRHIKNENMSKTQSV